MKITLIKREKPYLVRYFLDNGTDFAIDLDLANELCLSQEDTITEQKITELKQESDYLRAKKRALWYLERSMRTEKELYDKLVTASFSKKASAKVIARFKELGLVDDEAFARRYTEQCIDKNISKREIYAKLSRKGIKKELLSEVLEQTECDEECQIKALIDKKYYRYLNDKNDRKSIDKVYSSLARKGFSFGAIKRVLKEYIDSLEFTDEEY